MEDQFQQLPAAPFPAPPPFWKHFTSENIEKLAELEAQSGQKDAEIPLDLIYLRPPPPPPAAAESYTTFSIPQSLNPTPAPPPDDILLFDPKARHLNPATLLSRLTKSVLLNFLELTTILGNNPMQYEEKMSDINRIMLNIHYVINMYRPHQAREGVREMLQNRLEDGRKEIEKCDEMKEKVEAFLRSVEEQGVNLTDDTKTTNGTKASGMTSKDIDESRKLWAAIHNMDED